MHYVPKSSILFAGNGPVKISSVACGFSCVKTGYSVYPKSCISSRVCARIYFSFATIFANQIFCAIFSNLEPDFGHFSPKKSQVWGIFCKKCLLSLTPFILVDYCTHIDKVTKE